jgi:cytochrome c oxidase assembly protein subunit 15
VAMVVGFFILGTGAVAYRNFDAGDVRVSGVLAVLLLPLQVILGGTTVTFSGLLPWGYQPVTQAIHHLAALAIFGTLVYTTLRMRELAGPGLGRVRTASLAGLALLPLELAFSRGTLFAIYGTRVQLLHHAFELLVFAAALGGFVWARRRGATLAARAAGLASLLVVAQVLLGVGLFQFSAAVQVAYYALAAGVAALLVVAVRGAPDAPTSQSAATRAD